MFGVKQQRILVLEDADATTGSPAHLQIRTGAGKTKRDLPISAIAGIEESTGALSVVT